MTVVTVYSTPVEAKKLLFHGIIKNPLHSSLLVDVAEAAEYVIYEGNNLPNIPINWRFAESISALKGFQASMLNVLLKKKYDVDYQNVVINTDHAQTFFMSTFLWTLDPNGERITYSDVANLDIHHGFAKATSLSSACTNIYKTKDGRFYHLHGAIFSNFHHFYQTILSQYGAFELDELMNNKYRQAGTICWSSDEYFDSEHGRANAHVGLYELHHVPNKHLPPSWWTPVEEKTILDLTRIIAAPAITRELAELGASVLRITSQHIPDLTILYPDLGWGKWNACLDLRKKEDKSKLKALILESDVVVDGYRPGIMSKWGFGEDDILQIWDERGKGGVYAHENCYGWNGPWSGRSGWQQISDACCGVSSAFGAAMGLSEAVIPVFPNSDYSTGVAGSVGIVEALIRKASTGGSYVVNIALNYYSQWLVRSYLWARFDKPVFRNSDNMAVLIPEFLRMISEKAGGIIFNPDFFEERENHALGIPMRTVKPILQFPENVVKPGYNVGCRRLGLDIPKWPVDLMTEIIT
ncbi:CoA-transferase family III domain-containing protein [Cyathus striatus]|nr:CoA-transferase family III domain-containing protein [Cyathus striatus]